MLSHLYGKRRIHIELQGGLGNQIFQYIFGLLAIQHFPSSSISLITDWLASAPCDSLFYLLHSSQHTQGPLPSLSFHRYSRRSRFLIGLIDRFVAKAQIIPPLYLYLFCGIITGVMILREEDLKECSCELFMSRVVSKITKCPLFSTIVLRGYWQDFEDISTARQLFFKYHPAFPSANQTSSVNDHLTIAIHIRRNDYINTLNHAAEYASRLWIPGYIDMALRTLSFHVKSRVTSLVIFSDDLPWASLVFAYLNEEWDLRYAPSTSSAVEDWLSINSSDIIICSNSTFSYSAALLRCFVSCTQYPSTILPFWFNTKKTALLKGWHNLEDTLVL